MQQFLLVAAAHFLALLSPGPDFFLVARTSLARGWRAAGAVCVGIALANGVFIAAAFAGVSVLRADGPAFRLVQGAGCAYLFYLGWQFLRHAGRTALQVGPGDATRAAPLRGLAMGFLSGILNPKNALFYASLAAMLGGPQAGPARKAAYGAWMFCVVLGWDLLVAALIGHPRVLRRFSRALPRLERLSGVVLAVFAMGMAWALFAGLARAGCAPR